jgi:hypothetical protein
MRFRVGRLGHWLLAPGALIALACNMGSDAGDAGSSAIENNLLIARSSDGGVTWTAPAPLSESDAAILGDDSGPQVATDFQGGWIAAWDSTKLGDLPRLDSDIALARSSDAGLNWTARADLNNNADTDEGGDSNVQIVWGAQNTTWTALWQSWDSLGDTIGTDGDLLFARSTDDGLSWSDPAVLNSLAATDTEDDKKPQLATDGAGNWVAVWYSPEGYNLPPLPTQPPEDDDPADRDILTAYSNDNAVTWSASAPLNGNAVGDSGGDSVPQIVTDGTTWIAVWQISDIASPSTVGATESLGTGNDDDILYARSFDAGATWTYPEPLNTNALTGIIRRGGRVVYRPNDDRDPQLETDGSLWIAVWASADDLGSFADPVGSQLEEENDFDIQLARSTDAGATWSDPILVNNDAETDGRKADISPQVATDGTTWIVTWLVQGVAGPDLDIRMARSTNGGLTWSDPEWLNSNAASDDGDDVNQVVTIDEQGNWVAMWQSGSSL